MDIFEIDIRNALSNMMTAIKIITNVLQTKWIHRL